MQPFANISKLFFKRPATTADATLTTIVDDTTAAATDATSVVSQFILPASLTLQQLAQPAIQEKAREYLNMLGKKPTESQWNMILAAASSTHVIAGAGSGKSTTLIQRLLILHKLVGIPLEELHVFSFTKASTNEFHEKLLNMLKLWEEVIEKKTVTPEREKELAEQAKRTVSTFHSVLASLKRAVIVGDFPDFFDIPKDRANADEDLGAAGPFVTATVTASQQEILTTAHASAYMQSPHYRALINMLANEETRQLWMRGTVGRDIRAENEPGMWEIFLKQEQEYHGYDRANNFAPVSGFQDQADSWHVDPYRAAVADWLRKHTIALLPLAPFPVKSPIAGAWDRQMRAAFKAGNIWLHIERFQAENRKQGRPERSMAFHEITRRKFITTYTYDFAQHKVLTLQHFDTSNGSIKLNPQGDIQLQIWLNTEQTFGTLPAAPVVRVKLPGDIQFRPIANLLYQEGTFIESLGLEVTQLTTQGTQLDPISLAIAEALPIFWQAFQQELLQRRQLRFHDILSKLRDPETLRGVLDKVKHLRHVFIDEFQDISPDFIDWFQKNLRAQSESGVEASITAIGDDYQSIYGWRGSHPTFLMNFAQFFPSASEKQVVLEENFRSRQAIIDAAEAVLEDVQNKRPKHGKSIFTNADRGSVDPVRLKEAPLAWSQNGSGGELWQTFCQYAAELLHDLEATGTLSKLVGQRRELSVYILARTNDTNNQVPYPASLARELLRTLRQSNVQQFHSVEIKKYTYHKSKGLEADLVLLLDDAQPSEKHPFRELVFSQAAFLGQSSSAYQRTMDDETRRLAYVALTRARLGVMWVPLVVSSREDKTIQAQGCFVMVKNYLQKTAGA